MFNIHFRTTRNQLFSIEKKITFETPALGTISQAQVLAQTISLAALALYQQLFLVYVINCSQSIEE